ncbi:MAG TPA: zf-HC2 domain-containing protein [Terriglobia bacterium]|nr:zf-HC2 domain-containing protein [Terriglobia bacterium]
MECKRYEPWSADKVLGALDARRDAELTAHLAGCSRCRAALDREQLLFAAIHRGVAKSVEPSPSPEMAARIRERVTTEVAAERDERRSQTAAAAWLYGSRRWVPVAVAAALVLALGSLWMMHRRGGEHPEATRPAVARSAAPTGQPLPAIATDRASGVQPKRGPFPLKRTVTARAAIRGTLRRMPRTSPAEPEVLVDKEEAALVLQLYYSASHLPADDSASLHLSAQPERDADGNLAALEIPPLEGITDLEPRFGSDQPEGKTSTDAEPNGVRR